MNKLLSRITACTALILSGCAGVVSSECEAGDWYEVGRRDGRMGAWPQAELYSQRCGAQTKVDRARYAEGWRRGSSEQPRPAR